MLIQTLQTLFRRDLLQLRREIELYQREENIWRTAASISNSAGNICLHIIGNLNTYIGAEIGKTNYVRNRELEFSTEFIPQQELMIRIDQTLEVVLNSLDLLDEQDLAKEYPLLVLQEKMSTSFFLIHLSTHLSYHLGQINYHRRLID